MRIMKEYICVDDTFKNLDEDERKAFLKLISKTMHYTKADICKKNKNIPKHTYENCNNITCRRKQYNAYKLLICREFEEKLKSHAFIDEKGLIHTSDIDKVLDEMEECEW